MNLNTMTKNINVVIMSKSIDLQLMHDIIEDLKQRAEIYAMILHDKDINDNGECKIKHIHIVYELRTRTRLSTELRYLSKKFSINVNAISIEKMNNFVGSVQYLIHKNDSNKYQYRISDIYTNIDPKELNMYIEMENITFSWEYLKEVLAACENVIEIIDMIGLNYYRLYRGVINDIKKWGA